MIVAILGFFYGSLFTFMSHKLSQGKIAFQFLGVVVFPVLSAWVLADGTFHTRTIGTCLGAAILGHLVSLKPPKNQNPE